MNQFETEGPTLQEVLLMLGIIVVIISICFHVAC